MMAGTRRGPVWLTVVAAVLLIWGAMGVFAWLQQVRLGADAMGPASAYDRALYAALPAWYNVVYGIATVGGLAGAAALLLRSRRAVALFAASLVAVAVQFGWLFATTDIVAVKGAGMVVPFPVFIVAVATAQLWLALRALRRGWIA